MALNRGHLCWHEVGHHWFCCGAVCAISRRVFCCGRVGIDILVLWFCVFYMGLDSLHPSISHNLWVGFLCSYSLFWEISFLFETMQTNPPDNLIDTFEICNGTHENLTSFSVYFVTRSSVRSTKYPKSPKSPMLVGYAPFSQYNPVQ